MKTTINGVEYWDEEYREDDAYPLLPQYDERDDDHSDDCVDSIRDAIPKEDRIRLAKGLGKNWACIISGCGDQ